MIEFSGTAAAEFSAHHVVKNHLRCGRDHGHRWRVAVTIKAGQVPETGEVFGLPELATAVESLAAQLDRESINAFMPATQPTPAGVALSFREQLILTFRSITTVQVWMDDVSVTITS